MKNWITSKIANENRIIITTDLRMHFLGEVHKTVY